MKTTIAIIAVLILASCNNAERIWPGDGTFDTIGKAHIDTVRVAMVHKK